MATIGLGIPKYGQIEMQVAPHLQLEPYLLFLALRELSKSSFAFFDRGSGSWEADIFRTFFGDISYSQGVVQYCQ